MLTRGTMLAEMSGRLGDVVYARQKGVQYARAIGNPNPNAPTAEQTNIRNALASCKSQWDILNAAQRAGWAAYAKSIKRPNRIGDLRSIGGYNEFCRSNVLRYQANNMWGVPYLPVLDAPTRPDVEIPYPFPAPTCTHPQPYIYYYYDDSLPAYNDAGNVLLVYISPQLPSTVNWYRSPMTLVAGLDANNYPSGSRFALAPAVASVAGMRIFIKYRLSTGDGLLSEPVYDMITVQ